MKFKYLSTLVLLAVVTAFVGCSALISKKPLVYEPGIPTVTRLLSPTYQRVDELLEKTGKNVQESKRLLEIPLSRPESASDTLATNERLVLPGEDPADNIFVRRAKRRPKECCKVANMEFPATPLAPAQPLTELGQVADTASTSTPAPASTVQSLDFGSTFGYVEGQLRYSPWFGARKSVHMGEQVILFTYKCSALIPNTEHTAMIAVTASVVPTIRWESEYHRFVSIYGAYGTKGGNKDIVTGSDVHAGAITYVGQWQEHMCAIAKKMSANDILSDNSITFAGELTKLIKRDAMSPFEIRTQTAKVVLPEELLRALAKKGLEAKLVQKPEPKRGKAMPNPQSCPCDGTGK